jgi:hypothetical protein
MNLARSADKRLRIRSINMPPIQVAVVVGQREVYASSWSLMELLSIEKSTLVIEAFLPSMKLA